LFRDEPFAIIFCVKDVGGIFFGDVINLGACKGVFKKKVGVGKKFYFNSVHKIKKICFNSVHKIQEGKKERKSRRESLSLE